MKKLLFSVVGLLSLCSTAQALTYQSVRASTANIITPTLQTGTMNLSSGTIQNLSVTTATIGNFRVSTFTVISSATIPNLTVSTLSVTTFFTANGIRLTNVSSPTSSTDAATKGYVDILASGNTNYIQISNSLQVGSTFYVSSGTVNNFNSVSSTFTTIAVTTITPTGIKGTSTNDNANLSNYGAYISSATVATINSTGNSQYFTIVSTGVPAGDWDVSGTVQCTTGGATVTTMVGGIGLADGNSNTGFVNGQTALSSAVPTAAFDSGVSIPVIRASLSTLTPYYLKAFMAFSVATPGCYGSIHARRVR